MRKVDPLVVLALIGGLFVWGAVAKTEPGAFTFVMLPDTQFYSEKFPKFFDDQTKWIAANAKKENIAFVTHIGDIVQSGDEVEREWRVADGAMSRLDGIVPWGVAIGNHDYDRGDPRGRAVSFRRWFGPQRFRSEEWYRGASENGINSYQVFNGGGQEFLIMHLEADVPDPAIAWAKSVLERHEGVPAIVSTHIYLHDQTRARDLAPFYRKEIGNSGEAIWQKLIKPNPQIFMVLCGHWGKFGGEWFQVSTNDASRDVFEILADYQFRKNGGEGWMRTFRFEPEKRRILVKTYSPSLEKHETDISSQFLIFLDFEKRFSS